MRFSPEDQNESDTFWKVFYDLEIESARALAASYLQKDIWQKCRELRRELIACRNATVKPVIFFYLMTATKKIRIFS